MKRIAVPVFAIVFGVAAYLGCAADGGEIGAGGASSSGASSSSSGATPTDASTSSGGSSSGTGGPDGAAEPPCVTAATAQCGYEIRCSDGRVTSEDRERCIATKARICERSKTLPGASKLEVSCAAALATIPCESPATAALVAASLCPIVGQLANGARCESDRQCAGGFCSLNSEDCGYCGTLLGEGAACDAGLCKAGLACMNGRCGKRLGPGSPCVNYDDCLYPAQCGDGQCFTPSPEGSVCTVGGSVACAAHTSCEPDPANPGARKCTKDGRVYVKLGERCGFVGSQFAICTESAYCEERTPANDERCRARLDLGATCSAPLQCLPKLACVQTSDAGTASECAELPPDLCR